LSGAQRGSAKKTGVVQGKKRVRARVSHSSRHPGKVAARPSPPWSNHGLQARRDSRRSTGGAAMTSRSVRLEVRAIHLFGAGQGADLVRVALVGIGVEAWARRSSEGIVRDPGREGLVRYVKTTRIVGWTGGIDTLAFGDEMGRRVLRTLSSFLARGRSVRSGSFIDTLPHMRVAG